MSQYVNGGLHQSTGFLDPDMVMLSMIKWAELAPAPSTPDQSAPYYTLRLIVIYYTIIIILSTILFPVYNSIN